MALSTSTQLQIQEAIESLDDEILQSKIIEAEIFLENLALLSQTRLLTKQEHKDADRAIELLVRYEGYKTNKGWWFRFKRRASLVNQYFGQ